MDWKFWKNTGLSMTLFFGCGDAAAGRYGDGPPYPRYGQRGAADFHYQYGAVRIKGYAVGALDYVLKPVPYFAFSQQLHAGHVRQIDQIAAVAADEGAVFQLFLPRFQGAGGGKSPFSV